MMTWGGREIDAAIASHMPMVRRIAANMARRMPMSIEMDDLVQAGAIGLLDAATRFDVDRGIDFGAFAAERVRGEMIDALRTSDWFPRSVRSAQKKIEEASRTAQVRLKRKPTEKEVAETLQMPLTSFQAMLTTAHGRSLVDVDVHDERFDELPIAPMSLEDPYALLAEKRFTAALAARIAELRPRDRRILVDYYVHERLMHEIGADLGITESRVSQILREIAARLRGSLRDLGP